MALRLFARASRSPVLVAAGVSTMGAHYQTQNFGGAPKEAKETKKEPKTGVDFPLKSDDLELRGYGVRFKFGIVPVYAVGLYAPKTLVTTEWRDLHFERKELRMTLVRTLDRETFVKAIEDAVAKRCDDQRQVKEFRDLCVKSMKAKLVSGTVTTLRLEPDGRVALSIDGIMEGFVYTPQVADALLDVYLGPDSVSPSARDDIRTGLATKIT